jgi:hypothetical protein
MAKISPSVPAFLPKMTVPLAKFAMSVKQTLDNPAQMGLPPHRPSAFDTPLKLSKYFLSLVGVSF